MCNHIGQDPQTSSYQALAKETHFNGEVAVSTVNPVQQPVQPYKTGLPRDKEDEPAREPGIPLSPELIRVLQSLPPGTVGQLEELHNEI